MQIIRYENKKRIIVQHIGSAHTKDELTALRNKAEFILEYNENKKPALKRDDIDWTQSKVIFICPSFTQYQKEAINFKDLPIELWEIKLYENQTVSYEQVLKFNAKESIQTISKKDDTIEKVSKEIKVYTESEHIEKASEEISELYEKFKNSIINFDDIVVKPKKYYIAFVSGTNIVDIHIQKKSLKLWINLKKGELNDPKNIARDVTSVGHWGNGDYELQVSSDEDMEYILSLIRQSLKINKK